MMPPDELGEDNDPSNSSYAVPTERKTRWPGRRQVRFPVRGAGFQPARLWPPGSRPHGPQTTLSGGLGPRVDQVAELLQQAVQPLEVVVGQAGQQCQDTVDADRLIFQKRLGAGRR